MQRLLDCLRTAAYPHRLAQKCGRSEPPPPYLLSVSVGIVCAVALLARLMMPFLHT